MKLGLPKRASSAAVETALSESPQTEFALPDAPQQAAPEPAQRKPEVPDDDAPLPKSDPSQNPRNRIMKDIIARANADAVKSGDEPGYEAKPEDTPGDDLAAAAREADEAAARLDTDEPAKPAAAAAPAPVVDEDVTITVEGKPMVVKKSQIMEVGTRTLQKETAADYKLELASKLLAEAQKATQQPPVQQQQAAPQIEQMSDEQLAEMIQFGTKEQATAALKQLRQPVGPTPQELQKLVTEMPSQVRNQMAAEEAIKFADAEYADLIAIPYLKDAFASEAVRRRQAGDTRAPIELLKSVGEDMRVQLNRPKPGSATTLATAATPTNSTVTMEQRHAAKVNAPAAPKLASARMEGGGEAPRPKSRLEIINQARKARGQQPLSG